MIRRPYRTAVAAAVFVAALLQGVSAAAQTAPPSGSAPAGRERAGASAPGEVPAALPRITPSPAFDEQQLTAPPLHGWYTNGGNVYNQRYSPLDRIDRDNVAALKAVWRASLNGSGVTPRAANQAQPLVYDGTLYIVTGENDAFAIDIDTGKLVWQYTADVDPNLARPCCGWAARGVGMGDGKIFVGRLDAKLVALDQRTGEVVWSIQAEDPRQGFSITSAPLYYDGLVVTGFAGGDLGTRGRVNAYDADTGELVWRFYTVPGPGELGHDTWPADSEVWKYGGASVWQTPALDPEAGLLYFSTSNPGPVLNGNLRAGDNLFSVSIVAIDAHTGEYRWHFQQVHHDIWDYDSPNPIILFDAEYDGRMRKGLAQAAKTGWVYILDRLTGEPLIGIEERQKRDGTQLWEFQTDGGVNSTVATFLHAGKQFVAVLAGGTSLARSKRSDGVWLFALDGEIESLPRGSANPDGQFAAARAVTVPEGRQPDLTHGRELYRQTCMVCHGDRGQGGQHGGGLPLTDALTVEAIVNTVANGRNDMPAFGAVYSPEALQDVAGYILEELAPNQRDTRDSD
jgi:glucose dehydrogenase/mono/diheme cytochrome c family protein